MTHKNEATNAGLSCFGREVEAESARNLDLLKAIDSTISLLKLITAKLYANADYAEESIKEIEKSTGLIDGNNTALKQLEKAQSIVNDLYNELILRREFGRNDDMLSDGDGIEDAYTETIVAAAELHNNLNDLRWAINEHDADLSEVSKPYTNAEDLIKHLAA